MFKIVSLLTVGFLGFLWLLGVNPSYGSIPLTDTKKIAQSAREIKYNNTFKYRNPATEWFMFNKQNRRNGLFIDANGIRFFYLKGRLHREDGPAVEYPNGTKKWWLNGVLHREGGPAVEYSNGATEWWVHGVRHRIDGPAMEWPCGFKTWWVDGYILTEKEFNARRQCND